jgi:hypothetical protein
MHIAEVHGELGQRQSFIVVGLGDPPTLLVEASPGACGCLQVSLVLAKGVEYNVTVVTTWCATQLDWPGKLGIRIWRRCDEWAKPAWVPLTITPSPCELSALRVTLLSRCTLRALRRA